MTYWRHDFAPCGPVVAEEVVNVICLFAQVVVVDIPLDPEMPGNM